MTIHDLSKAAREELVGNILPYWVKYGRDPVNGGYWGTLRDDNVGDPAEPRSVVMTARHLWAYSAASVALDDPSWLESARWAYEALTTRFVDGEYGGVYWSVRPDGMPEVAKKQVYGEAFAVYGLAEYAGALLRAGAGGAVAPGPSGGAGPIVEPIEPLGRALALFELLELHARDSLGGGYIEALARDWSPTQDLKLSDKDIDCDKSMNTNLHVMEALTTLHRVLTAFVAAGYGEEPVAPGGAVTVRESLSRVAAALATLVDVTMTCVLGPDAHLDLYFDLDWQVIGDVVSYGHDIEASWLLWEAIEELESACAVPEAPAGGERRSARWRDGVVRIARVALAEGFDAATGALENETHGGHRDRTRVWWCQAEALVGFYNAWEMTGEAPFLAAALAVWDWIDRRQADRVSGDWFASVDPAGVPNRNEPKGGNWKTPYHNARACMEIMRRVGATENTR